MRELLLLAQANCERIRDLLAKGPTLTQIVTSETPECQEQILRKLFDVERALDATDQVISHEKLRSPGRDSQSALATIQHALAEHRACHKELAARAQDRFSNPEDLEWHTKPLTRRQTRELCRDLQEVRLEFWSKLFEFPLGRRQHAEAILDLARRGNSSNHNFLFDGSHHKFVAVARSTAEQVAHELAEIAPDPLVHLGSAASARVSSLLCKLPPKPESAISLSNAIEAKCAELADLEAQQEPALGLPSAATEASVNAAARIRELQQDLGGSALEVRHSVAQLMERRAPYLAIKNYLFLANRPLVASLLKDWQPRGFDVDDLRQAASTGLLKAIERFYVNRGTTFATCAYLWMKQSIGAFIRSTGNVVYVPAHLAAPLKEIQESDALREGGASIPDLAAKLSISTEQAQALVRVSARVHRVHGIKDGSGFEGTLPSDLPAPDESAGQRDLAQFVAEKLMALPERERTIVQCRFGIGKERSYSLGELSAMFSVSRERIRQIEANVLLKLASAKNPANLLSLKDIL